MHMIETSKQERILELLREIESRRGVRVLYVVEAGSRVWGHASPGSDHDVRFIFHSEINDYVLGHAPDVIEQMVPEEGIDVVGWDLRKFADLAAKGNVAPQEWIASPTCYASSPIRDGKTFRDFALPYVDACWHWPTAFKHYTNLAMGCFEKAARKSTIKHYLYLIRCLSCARITCQTYERPPLHIRDAIRQASWSPAVVEEFEHLVDRKANCQELTTLDWKTCAQIAALVERPLRDCADAPKFEGGPPRQLMQAVRDTFIRSTMGL